MVYGPCGVLENVMQLVGYETICYIIADDPKLAEDIFEAVGSRLVRYYELSAIYNTVGVLMSNDDWGFKTQTMLSPDDMRKFVFPWHKQIVSVAHANGKPVILHSCGCLTSVMDDVIDDMGYDGKHSYEDTIQTVESAYDQYHDRIAILGGIDLDFLCRSTPEKIYMRSKKLFERAESHGAYALGTGNSVPEYVPDRNYFAMIQAALDLR
ncbi:uroporphyrinogen-III decarboxylase-like protein, partial [bacterium]|nr:uroporphyrinogen-III decarboxylase-like protein [bacterium]